MRKPLMLVALTALTAVALAALAGPAAAQGANDGSVLVLVDGDATVGAGESHDVVVVVDGDLDIEGEATTVVVVNGRVEAIGATIETLVVVDGTVDLGAGTTVTGDVHLVESDMTRDPTASVEGTVKRGSGGFIRGFWILGVLFMIGWAVMVVLAALVLAAIAPDFARRAGRTITTDPGSTIVAGLVLWIVVPIVGVLLFATVIGIPAALTIWFALLPAVGLIGLLVAGVRLGELVTGTEGGVGRPLVAAFVGAVILLVLGAIPLLGPIVVVVAAFLGSGTVALLAFRSVRGRPPAPPPSWPAPPAATTSD